MLCLQRIEGEKSKGQISKVDTIWSRWVSRENFSPLILTDWLESTRRLTGMLLLMAASVNSGSCQVSFLWI